MSRHTSFSATKIGMLSQIIYPTGGSIQLEYEPNEFIFLGTTIEGGGLRIKKQRIVEVALNYIDKEFYYMQNKCKLPRFGTLNNSKALGYGASAFKRNELLKNYTLIYTENQTDLNLFNRRPIG